MKSLESLLAPIPLTDGNARHAVIVAYNERKEKQRIKRHAAVLASLYASWFEGVVGIFIDPEVQSQSIAEDGTILLGTGMHFKKCDASFTFHELSHFLEVDTRRMGKKDWGLRYPKATWYSRGRYGWGKEYHPKTYKGLERELRVIAIADTIAGHFDPKKHVQRDRKLIETTSLLNSVVGADLCPGKNRKEKTAWCLEQYTKLRAQYTYEGLYAEWLRRTKLLKRRVEDRARRSNKVRAFILS